MQQHTPSLNADDACKRTGIIPRRGFIQTGSLLAFNAVTASSRAEPSAKKDIPLIDTHMHVWSNDDKRYPFPHPYVPGFSIKDVPHEGTVEMLIKDMDQNACTHAVLVQVIYHGWDNSYVADCVQRFPDRL